MHKVKYLRVCSDLHLEHSANRQMLAKAEDRFLQLVPPDARDSSSMLILAGDISAFREHMELIFQISENRFAGIIYVAGNHEFWGSDISDWDAWAEKHSSPTVFIAKQYELLSLHIQDVEILATTLWTQCGFPDPMAEMAIRRLPDFRRININGKPISTTDIQSLSTVQAGYLGIELKKPGPKIVITHHLPSFQLCDARFKGSLEDGLFASNYDHLLTEPLAPKWWIHGHTHIPIDRQLGDSRIICNPAGYPGELKPMYNPYLFLDLSEVTDVES